MSFGRWILVHSFSISIVIMLGIGFVYQDELKLREAYRQLLQVDPEKIISQTEKAITSPKVEDNPLLEKNDSLKAEKSIENNLDTPQTESNVSGKQKIAETEIKPYQEKNEEQNLSITEKQPSIQNFNSLQQLVEMARQNYWSQNYNQSVNYYLKALENHPSEGDLYGELGNVYFKVGELSLASEAYLNAGKQFLNQGQSDRAKNVYDLLLNISPDTANQLLVEKNKQDLRN